MACRCLTYCLFAAYQLDVARSRCFHNRTRRHRAEEIIRATVFGGDTELRTCTHLHSSVPSHWCRHAAGRAFMVTSRQQRGTGRANADKASPDRRSAASTSNSPRCRPYSANSGEICLVSIMVAVSPRRPSASIGASSQSGNSVAHWATARAARSAAPRQSALLLSTNPAIELPVSIRTPPYPVPLHPLILLLVFT